MQNNLFVNREAELEWLNRTYKGDKSNLLIIYGRRRVGKSFLLTHFLKGKKALYYLCSEDNEKEQIGEISKSIGELFQDTALILNPFSRWEDFFKYLYEKTKNQKFILVIDEFPYLVNANPAVPSIFQKYWDLYLKNSKTCLILNGSSIGMMESIGINYRSPLYGRRTGQWRLNPLKFKDFLKFFKNNIEGAVRFYSITGGVPFYVVELDKRLDCSENIRRMMNKGSIFYDEGEILIKSELKDASTYFSILRVIAKGIAKHKNIANKINIEITSLPKYLSTLANLGYIEKVNIISEKEKSKKTKYFLKDNFMNFWFGFIEPAKRYVEEANDEEISKILKEFEVYVSKRFEDLIRNELFAEVNKELKMLNFKKLGRWWGYYRTESNERREIEIDLVALNNKTKEILFCECKWKDKVDAEKIVKGLNEKTEYIQWHNEKRKESFAVFAKSFSKKIKEFEGRKVYCYDLKDVEKVLKRR